MKKTATDFGGKVEVADKGKPTPFTCVDGPETTIVVTVTTDNYPEETSWTLLDVCSNNQIIASGGGYGAKYTTYTDTVTACASDFEFTISDDIGTSTQNNILFYFERVSLIMML